MSDLTRDLFAYLMNHMYSVSYDLRVNGYWVMSQPWLQEIRMMTDPDGRVLLEAGVSIRDYGLLFGRPIHVDDRAGLPRLSPTPVFEGEDWVALKRYV